MSLPLLRKEVREHGVVLAIVFLIGALALLGFLYEAGRGAGRFTALVRFAGVFGLLNALVLASRLIVREYAGRTQLFLEVLPVSRARVYATKWLLGLCLMELSMLLAWLATLAWAGQSEVVTRADAFATLGSVALYALCLWSFAALAGTLGRYRYVAWLAAIVAAAALIQIGGAQFAELPVIRLLGADVAMGLGVPSNAEFVHAAGMALASMTVAPLLALAGSGSMASALAQRMTVRERVFLITCVLGTLTLFEVLEPKPIKPPFELTTEQQVKREHAQVGIMETLDIDAAQADALARTIADDLESFIAALGWNVRPTVFVLPQQGLDPSAMQRAYLGEQDGIVIRAAPNAPRDVLRAFVLHELLMDESLQRGMLEDRHVLLDGVAAYWAMRDDAEARERWRMRAAIAGPINAETFLQWSLTSEHLGECLSQGVAFVAFDALITELGKKNALKLLQTIFAEPKDDARVLFETAPAKLLAEAGITWAQLAERTESARLASRQRHAGALATRPTITSRIAWEHDATNGNELRVTVEGVTEYRVLYEELLPWSADALNMLRLDVRGRSAVVPFSPAKDSRWLIAIELDDPVLGCPVRVFAERVGVP